MARLRTLKSLTWMLAFSTALALGAANSHVHLDDDHVGSCEFCLLSDHSDSLVDSQAQPNRVQPVPQINPTPVALPLQRAILGFLIRAPPASVPA